MRTLTSATLLGLLCQVAACTSEGDAASDRSAGRCPPDASELATSLVVIDARGEARYGRIQSSAEVTELPIEGKADGGVGAQITLTLDDGSVATIDSDIALPLAFAAGDRVWLDAEIFLSYPSTSWSMGVVRAAPGGPLLYGFAMGPLGLIDAEPFTNAGLSIRSTEACPVIPGQCWGVTHQQVRYASDRDAITLFGHEESLLDVGGQELRIHQAWAYAADQKHATSSCGDAVPFGVSFAFAATSNPASDDDAGANDARPLDAAVACNDLRAQHVLACAIWADSTLYERPIALTGTVEEIKRGPWGCNGGGGDFYPELGSHPWRARISDGTRDVWFGMLLPWDAPLVEIGDVVSVEHAYAQGIWEPSEGNFVLRAANGSLIAWLGVAARTDDLMTPEELTVQDSDDVCTAGDSCGTFDKRGFRVRVGETEAVLQYGSAQTVGSFAVLHAGNEHQVSAAGCADWFVASSRIAAVRGGVEELTARDNEADDSNDAGDDDAGR